MSYDLNKVQWNEKGYTVIEDLLSIDSINSCKKYLEELYNNNEIKIRDFGSDGKLEFPSCTILDYLSMDEKIINFVQSLLNTNDILLCQCDTWGKEGSNDFSDQSNNDQRIHMDYGNNMFLHPSDWEEPEAVAAIIYLSDVRETLGGTAVVPKNKLTNDLYKFPYINMPGISGNKFINNKHQAEQYFKESNKDIYDFRQRLYDNEIILKPKLGSILFYRLDIWHRGTPVKKDKTRFVMNLLWKKKECTWINTWNPGWTKEMYYGKVEEIFTKLTPLQRSLLGIPMPGDKYWTIQKIELLKVRYPNIDINPYLEKLDKSKL